MTGNCKYNVQYDPWGIVSDRERGCRRGYTSFFSRWNGCGLNPCGKECADDHSEWMIIHPSPRTRMFKEILLGEFGYTEGQGIYNSVRSTEMAIRQLQATMLTNTLDAVRYEELKRDWNCHVAARGLDAKSIAVKYGYINGETEAVKVADTVFNTWRKTLQGALLDMVRGVAARFSASEPDSTASFSKYIDWICCLGMVPMIRRKRKQCRDVNDKWSYNIKNIENQNTTYYNKEEMYNNLEIAKQVLLRGRQMAIELAECMEAVTIIEYDRAIIEYNFKKREVRVKDVVTGERGECIVIWRPVMRNEGVIFDSPLQRIYHEVMACYSLRRHVDVCRLLNTAPVKVILGKRSEEERGISGARKLVERALGEGVEEASSSAASRLLKLMINMRGMKHIGNITDTVREYLDETCGNLLDTSTVDTTQAGFGRINKSRSIRPGQAGYGNSQKIGEAFQTSVVNNINNMLEGYVNKLFSTIEELKSVNEDMSSKLRLKDNELGRLRRQVLKAKQSEADALAEARVRVCYGPNWPSLNDDDGNSQLTELGRDVIDISTFMGDDMYVANSFQSRYVPSYDVDLNRLSALWEQELLRCFKMTRLANHQGQETSISYSNSAITLLLAPYFYSVLQIQNLGPLVTNQEAYHSEEELCVSIFQKSRIELYLEDIIALFVAEVKRELSYLNVAVMTSKGFESISSTDDEQNVPYESVLTSALETQSSEKAEFLTNDLKKSVCPIGIVLPNRTCAWIDKVHDLQPHYIPKALCRRPSVCTSPYCSHTYKPKGQYVSLNHSQLNSHESRHPCRSYCCCNYHTNGCKENYRHCQSIKDDGRISDTYINGSSTLQRSRYQRNFGRPSRICNAR